MGQKETMRFARIFISFVIFGSDILPSVNAASKVRLISPTPYLFPELSISGHLFNFLPPFSTRAELSSKPKWKKSNIHEKKLADNALKTVEAPSKALAENKRNRNTENKTTKNEPPSTLRGRSEQNKEKENPTQPFKGVQNSINSNTNISQEFKPQQKKKKHNRHFIGRHIGGVGGVFPPVSKASKKENLQHRSQNVLGEKEGILTNMNYNKSENYDSICFHENKIYNAGETIKMDQKSNPCDECRCEQRGGGGIINCFWQQCEGLPAYDCVPLFIPGACCPIYSCEGDGDLDI